MSAFPGSSGKQVVLLDSGNFPGFSNFLNETWTFSGTDWTNQSAGLVNSAGPLPGRINGAMAFDGTNVMLFGGQGAENSVGVLNDTWVWSGTAWTQKTGVGFALTGPSNRFGAEAAYLSTIGTGGVMMFGGTNLLYNLLETWLWDGTAQTWTLLSVANGSSPNARTGHCMASNGTKAILFGGSGTNSQFNDTWSFTMAGGGTWTKLAVTTPPSIRSGACMAYDIANSQWVMFGGMNEYNYLVETWVLNTGATAWTQVSVPAGTGPSGRVGAQMAYDAGSSTVVMFGGLAASDSYASDGTWSFNGGTLAWTKL
jgi:hypothetical protein